MEIDVFYVCGEKLVGVLYVLCVFDKYLLM